ncbi:MAG: prepilin-type N-terminal cleavage/methylation domain-containing protein [Pontiellaceae bacterium]|jgi:prepilin-type N-terminal cleavage/methylation domain-containing protein|nr:prepilin-type N-terminal cleavage/methylation domain-containing protein [Pontiellaceae bacterium]
MSIADCRLPIHYPTFVAPGSLKARLPVKCRRIKAVLRPNPDQHSAFGIRHSAISSGFTLLEVMIAILIMSIAMAIAFQTFSAVTRAWSGARVLIDKVHHGDFVMGQLTAALRSMSISTNAPEKYGFRIENNSEGEGEHTICWVTDSGAFMPPGEICGHTRHRIEVGAGRDDDGIEGLVVTVWPYLADEEEVKKGSWLVSESIKGLRCRIYDTKEGEEGWTDQWEYSNAIPGLVEITLYAEPPEEYGDPVEFRQLIEIPLGPPVTNKLTEAK